MGPNRTIGLDEHPGIRSFADVDLAQRVRQAGFTLAVAHDLFVHHHGHAASLLTAEPMRLID